MSQLRKVDLQHKGTNENISKVTPMMSKGEAQSYEEDKQNILAYIKGISNLLQEHNRQIAPIVNSYKSRQNNPQQ